MQILNTLNNMSKQLINFIGADPNTIVIIEDEKPTEEMDDDDSEEYIPPVPKKVKKNKAVASATGAEAVAALAAGAAAQGAPHVDEEGDFLVNVPSDSQQGLSYKVNVTKKTCECPDYKYRSQTNPSHQCKHIKQCIVPTPVQQAPETWPAPIPPQSSSV
jgi:hypothetical protein